MDYFNAFFEDFHKIIDMLKSYGLNMIFLSSLSNKVSVDKTR